MAEILMMQEILLKKRNVIMVLPYVSIVQEKVGGSRARCLPDLENVHSPKTLKIAQNITKVTF